METTRRVDAEEGAILNTLRDASITKGDSLTPQCVQLYYSPRVSIVHTSRSEVGQIYIPSVNTALMIGCLLLVLGFGSSSALGAAYGIAVTGTMTVTTMLFYVIARQHLFGLGFHLEIRKLAGLDHAPPVKLQVYRVVSVRSVIYHCCRTKPASR